MGFKAMAAKDLSIVFLNIETFGEKHVVEGKEISILIDNDQLKEKQGGQDLAIAESGTLFFARSMDLPPRRMPKSTLTVDGRVCTVDDWTEDMGLATVVLSETIIV